MDKILKLIFRHMRRMEINSLPFGLKGGKVGVLLFYALYSGLLQQPGLRNKCYRLLGEIIYDISFMKGRLLYGRWGVLWALQLLVDKKVLEEDKELEELLQPIKLNYLYSYMSTPIRIIEEDNLFSEGICAYCQWSEEDTLERYSTEERLISLVDECERLLTLTIPAVYTPKEEMTPALLHSIVYFLLKMKQHGIYPYKVEQTLQQAGKFYQCMEKDSLADGYILTSLLPEEESLFPTETDDKTLYHFLAEVGFYSLLYDTPALFYDAYHQLEKKEPDFEKRLLSFVHNHSEPTQLLGLGYGILQCKFNNYA